MKLKEYRGILRSSRDGVQSVIVYDGDEYKDIEDGCSVEYALLHYGDKELYWITAENNKLVLHIHE